MKRLPFVISVFVIVFCLSCCSKKDDVTVIGGSAVKVVKNCDFFDARVSDWDYSIMTYPCESVYSTIQKSVSQDGLFFISDGMHLNINKIAVFTDDGTFRNFIGTRGHSKSEYTSIRAWCIDSYRNKVVVLTPGNTVNEYDYEGHYIQTWTPELTLTFVEQIEALPWGGYIVKNTLNDALEDEFFTVDSSWNKLYSIKHRDIKIKGMRSSMSNSIAICDGSVFCMRDICDDIYEITPGGIVKRYVIKSGNPAIEWNGQTSDEINKIQYRSGCSFASDFFSVKDYLVINDPYSIVLWNIKSGEGWKFLQESLDKKEGMPITRAFSGVDGDCMYCMKTPESIAVDADALRKMEMTPSPRYQELLQHCQQDENNESIVLLRYKIKAD